MAFNIKDKRVLITGGTAGIGLAVTERFVEHGAQVIISGRREEGEDIARRIGARFIQADMASEYDVVQLFDRTAKSVGKLDVVINNAGVGHAVTTITDTVLDDYDRTMNINQRAAFQVLQLAPSYMVDGGSIINTASISGVEGGAGSAVYAASKAALVNLTQSSALELASRRIRVNAVSPGPIRTAIWGDIDGEAFAKLALPLARMGKPEECTGAYHFLASDDSSFITGINLIVDGGYCSGMSPQSEKLMMGV